MNAPKKVRSRKLLVAAIGVATVNLAGLACSEQSTSGNLPAPNPVDAAQQDSAQPPPTSGNLVAPPPVDAGPDVVDAADASDGGDAGDEDGGDAG